MRILSNSILGRVTEFHGFFMICLRPSRQMTSFWLAIKEDNPADVIRVYLLWVADRKQVGYLQNREYVTPTFLQRGYSSLTACRCRLKRSDTS
jgi:hypothetical protein